MNQNRFSPAPDGRGAPGGGRDTTAPGRPEATTRPAIPANSARPARPGRMVALVGAMALVATLVPVAIAAGMSTPKGDDAKVVETVRAVTLGGDDPTFSATFAVPEGEPDCDREISLTVGAQQFSCGDVTIETRSAEGVEDLERYGIRAIRAKLLAEEPAPAMRPAITPNAPAMVAWSGPAVTGYDGTARAVIVLGEGRAAENGGASGGASEGDGASGEDGTPALVAVISGGEAGTVDAAAETILADVREGGVR